MPNYQHPGIYVREVDMGARPIEGVSTSVAGFIGLARRGAIDKPTLVTSWTDFVNKFAYGLNTPFMEDSYLAYSVFGFFNNGGTRAYILRIAEGTAAKATAAIKNVTEADLLTFTAIDEGVWGNNIKINLATNTTMFDLTVKYNDVVVSKYEKVSLTSTDANFIETVVNGLDKYIAVSLVGTDTPKVTDLGSDITLTTGSDGADASDADFTAAFDLFDEVDDVNILVVPDSQAAAVVTDGLAYCEGRGDCVFLYDGASTDTATSIITFKDSYSSDYGALYFPWIKVNDPIAKSNDKTKFVPVAGHVAGVIARIDTNRSVYKAPAGMEAVVFGALATKEAVNDTTQDTLNPVGINVVRAFKNAGIVVWGARTNSGKYLNIRRGLNYLKASLKLGLRWAVFEPNNGDLWRKMNIAAKSFLLGEYKKGGFKGTNPAEAFFVKCDGEINSADVVSIGQVKLQAGVAIAEPGEFVVLEVGQWDSGASANEV